MDRNIFNNRRGQNPYNPPADYDPADEPLSPAEERFHHYRSDKGRGY
jgi:hypothetical protein